VLDAAPSHSSCSGEVVTGNARNVGADDDELTVDRRATRDELVLTHQNERG
jgi:hypothetical protein